MSQSPKAGLRNEAEKKGAGIRKNLSTLDAFVKKWRNGLRRQGKAWEGIAAVAELKRRGMLEFLLAEGRSAHSRAIRHLFGGMFHEIQSYKKDLMGPLVKEQLDRVEDFLERTQSKIQKQERLANDRDIVEILQRLEADVLKARGALSWRRFKRKEFHFGFLQELLWPEVPKKRLVSRRVELDTSLQVGLGKVLILYLHPKKVSLETVARLVLLAYWAGDLSETSGDFSKSKYTGRVLKVRNIRENLRDAKLHDAAGFDAERTPTLMAKLQLARKILGPASSKLGVLPRLYLSQVAIRFSLTKKQIARLIRTGSI